MSLMIEDVYKDMPETKMNMTSPTTQKAIHGTIKKRKKVKDKMKEECGGTLIAEYIGLRPKLYSVLRLIND